MAEEQVEKQNWWVEYKCTDRGWDGEGPRECHILEIRYASSAEAIQEKVLELPSYRRSAEVLDIQPVTMDQPLEFENEGLTQAAAALFTIGCYIHPDGKRVAMIQRRLYGGRWDWSVGKLVTYRETTDGFSRPALKLHVDCPPLYMWAGHGEVYGHLKEFVVTLADIA